MKSSRKKSTRLSLSARNLKGTQMAIASDINTYGIMNAEVLVVTESSLEVINNTLAKKEA